MMVGGGRRAGSRRGPRGVGGWSRFGPEPREEGRPQPSAVTRRRGSARPPPRGEPRVAVKVPQDALRCGCGREGAAVSAPERCPTRLGTEEPSVPSRRPREGLRAESAAGWGGGRRDAVRSYTWRQGCTPRCCGGLDLASAAEEWLSMEDRVMKLCGVSCERLFAAFLIAPLPRLSPYVRATVVAGCDRGKR